MERAKHGIIKCLSCGKEVVRLNSRIAVSKKHFCSHNCWRSFMGADTHPKWKGGQIYDGKGRIYIYSPNHPGADKRGYVNRGRLIAEKAIGKFLPNESLIHHYKGITDDHSIVVCQDKKYHAIIHQRTRVVKGGGDPNTQILCYGCREVKDQSEFGKNKYKGNGFNGYCKICHNERQRKGVKQWQTENR